MGRKLVLLAAAIGLLSLASVPPASPNPKAAIAQENGKSTQVFNGTVVQSGDKYLLDDTANKITYELDDAKKAGVFVGKKVRVIGSLDAAKKLIHVESVEEVT